MTTPNLALNTPANGTFVGTWDVPVNANWNLIDSALGGIASIALSNVPVVLSAAQYANGIIAFSGTLTGNVVVTFPAIGRFYILYNNCVAATSFTITCQISGVGTNIVIPPVDPCFAVTDGVNMKFVGGGRRSGVALPGGRATLATATPVMTSSVSAATTVYYSPYVSQFVPLFDGSEFQMTDIGGELSQATTDSTKSPAAVAADSNYDLFVWNNAGVIRCTRGPAWTSSTARGAGAGTTELTRVEGLWLNTNAITNGPAARQGTYVGTIRSNASSQIDFIFGAAALGGTAGSFGVWNAYNRVEVGAMVLDTTASWNHNSAVYRQMNGSAGNQVSFICGLSEDAASMEVSSLVTCDASGFTGLSGIGVDSTTVASGISGRGVSDLNITTPVTTAHHTQISTIGWHTWAALEAITGGTGLVFIGGITGPPAANNSGLKFNYKM